MEKRSSPPLPIPLFDTLENLAADQIDAPGSIIASDFHHARQFILSYRGSPDTFNAYRREVERLLQWLSLIAKKTLIEVRRADFEEYLTFCQKPPISWIGVSHAPRFRDDGGKRVPNPGWRPFIASASSVKNIETSNNSSSDPTLNSNSNASKTALNTLLKNYKLSKKAFHQIMTISSSFFNFLIQEGLSEINPVLQIRQKNKYLPSGITQQTVRRLSDLQWAYVIETAEKMAQDNPLEHERTLFIMNALYGMYLRISELAATPRWEPQMKDFFKDNDGNWWFTTVGKGNKQRQIAISNHMLEALKRYRTSLNLTPLPSPHETTPLIRKYNGNDPIKSTRRLRGIVQACFDFAIERMQKDGFEEDAETLKSATVHWLRHTGISEDVKTRPREHVRDDAGHGSGAITDRYIDVELRERHASAKKKLIKHD